jgi:hypothetical protein
VTTAITAADLKPKKSKAPAPGSYNIEDCFKKTQWNNKVHSISKTKSSNYVDEAVKSRKHVPGIGKYQETERGYRALSKPPTSLRKCR